MKINYIKVFTIFLLILLLAIIFSIIRKKDISNNTNIQNTLDSTEKQNREIKDISSVLNNFYNYYLSCMKNPPSQASGMVSEYCQTSSGLTTDNFKENLNKAGTAQAGADPIVCSQSFPESINIGSNIQINNNNALAVINENIGTQKINIMADLQKISDSWKIDNLICPLP